MFAAELHLPAGSTGARDQLHASENPRVYNLLWTRLFSPSSPGESFC
jgi:hypothetical protein